MTSSGKLKPFTPSPIGEATTRHADGRTTLIFVKEFAHPPAAVWRALTEPDALSEWSPFDAPRSLATPGPVTLVMAGGGDQSPAVVHRAEPPRLLEYTWEGDLLRWELTESATGTRLTLSHTLADRAWLAKVTAGWHLCLDVAARWLDGVAVGRIAAEDATLYGWEELRVEYARRFGES